MSYREHTGRRSSGNFVTNLTSARISYQLMLKKTHEEIMNLRRNRAHRTAGAKRETIERTKTIL